MKNTDGNLLREHLFTWNAVDMQSTLLEENIRTLFDATVPIRFERISNRQKPLITNSIKRAIDLSDLAYSRWKRLRTAEMKFQYSATRANVNKCIRCVKMEYYFRVHWVMNGFYFKTLMISIFFSYARSLKNKIKTFFCLLNNLICMYICLYVLKLL